MLCCQLVLVCRARQAEIAWRLVGCHRLLLRGELLLREASRLSSFGRRHHLALFSCVLPDGQACSLASRVCLLTLLFESVAYERLELGDAHVPEAAVVALRHEPEHDFLERVLSALLVGQVHRLSGLLVEGGERVRRLDERVLQTRKMRFVLPVHSSGRLIWWARGHILLSLSVALRVADGLTMRRKVVGALCILHRVTSLSCRHICTGRELTCMIDIFGGLLIITLPAELLLVLHG